MPRPRRHEAGQGAAGGHAGRSAAAATDTDDGYSDDFESEDSGDEVLLKQRDRIIKNVQGVCACGVNCVACPGLRCCAVLCGR
jgi:hypothetical protein